MRIFNLEIGRRKVSDEYIGSKRDRFISRWRNPPAINTVEWLNMFSTSPRLAVVDRIASDIANLKGKLLRIEDDGTEIEVTDHAFYDFMNHPNPLYEMTSSAIWRLHEIYLLLVGESFFLIERDNLGKPVELWNIPPHWVKSTPYLGNPTYSVLSPGGMTMTVPVDDMFVMKQLNPLDPYLRGSGIAQSIADEVEIDEYAAKFQKRFFYNDATPPLVFLMPDASDEQRNTFMARWNKKHKGVENSHRVAALSGNVDVRELGGTDGKNLGFIESRIAMRDAVLEHFGVPREIMGITENSNRATADSAQYIYAKNVLMPRIQMREEAINKQLLPLFGDRLVWRFDPVVPYDKDFNKAKALDGWNTGLLTKNEARKLMDLPSVEEGNIFKTSANDLYMGVSDDPVEITKNKLQNNTIKSELKNREIKQFDVKNEDNLINMNMALFKEMLTNYFKNQQKQISVALGLNTKIYNQEIFEIISKFLLPDGTFNSEMWNALSEIEQIRITETIASNLIDWNSEIEKLVNMLEPLWEKAYDDGVKLSEENYGLQNIVRPEFTSSAKINGGKRIVDIITTTKNKIANIIAKGISEGLNQTTVKELIQNEMLESSEKRIETIARNETMTALATGQFDMMKNAGATIKKWNHRPQKNPRDGSNGPNHVVLDGERVKIDEKFSNGLLFPRDPNCIRAEEVINCRCYLMYEGF